MYVWALIIRPIFTAPPSPFSPARPLSQGIDAPGRRCSHRYDMIPGVRPLFQLRDEFKSLANENISSARHHPFKIDHGGPSFGLRAVFRCSQPFRRNPYYHPTGQIRNQFILATPHCYTTRFSSRHDQGGHITFSDGHAAYFKYDYVVSDGTPCPIRPDGRQIAAGHDPGHSDINWDCRASSH